MKLETEIRKLETQLFKSDHTYHTYHIRLLTGYISITLSSKYYKYIHYTFLYNIYNKGGLLKSVSLFPFVIFRDNNKKQKLSKIVLL